MHPIAAPGQVRQGVAQVGIVVRRAVDRLGNALAIGIVAVGDAAAGLAHGRQLAAVLPGVGPRAVGQGIAYGIVGDGLPIKRRQQVRPIGVAVAAPERLAPSGDTFQGLAAEKVYYNCRCDTTALVRNIPETFLFIFHFRNVLGNKPTGTYCESLN